MNKREIETLKTQPIVLSDESWSSLIKTIEKASKPNKALKKAFEEYSKIEPTKKKDRSDYKINDRGM